MDQTDYDMTLPEALDVARTPSECGEDDVLAALGILARRVRALEAVATAATEVDELLHADEPIYQNAEAAERLGQALLDLREAR